MRIGVDFGGTNVKFGIFDDNGETVRFETVKLAKLQSGGKLLAGLVNKMEEISAGSNLSAGGFAIKGLVNRETGELMGDVGAAEELKGINIREYLSEKFLIPFAVDNDARAYAYGEYIFGAGKGMDSLAVVTVGTGIGCAVIYNGQLYGTNNPLSGVLGGHLSIDRNGPLCPCGNKGCMEYYCSASAFQRKVTTEFSSLGKSPNPMEIFFNELDSNQNYRNTLNEYCENFSIGLTNIIHAYGVENIILGGGLMKSSGKIIPIIKEKTDEKAWTVPRGKVNIIPAILGDKAAAMGIAFL